MKVWQLVLVQLWVLLFTPAWMFTLIFSPLVLTPTPAWPAFLLMVCPPFIAVFFSIAMWVAKSKQNVRWQNNMAVTLIILPIITVIIPFIFFE